MQLAVAQVHARVRTYVHSHIDPWQLNHRLLSCEGYSLFSVFLLPVSKPSRCLASDLFEHNTEVTVSKQIFFLSQFQHFILKEAYIKRENALYYKACQPQNAVFHLV